MQSKSSKEQYQCTTIAAIDNLATQLLNQRVVFFVGAGFSLDIENVSTKKLMASLLCRFLAMTEYVATTSPDEANRFRHACNQVFGLKLKADKLNDTQSWLISSLIGLLVSRYYQVNEWMVQVYGELYQKLPDKLTYDETEKSLHTQFSKENIEILPLAPLNKDLIESVDDKYKGKVIFIETVGIANDEIMQSYLSKKRPDSWLRYTTFGKLAREGLMPTLLTTNYDLLLERGFQSVGLQVADNLKSTAEKLPHLPSSAMIIRQPLDYFNYSASMNPAHIVKIHGCAQQYREYKQKLIDCVEPVTANNPAKLQFEEYLASIIYTYREIQNWRDDAWSRDYLHTLLRTRTFVFCGYSGADPVMHNSIRNIYEEMQRKDVIQSRIDAIAPAYSTSGGGIEFDSLELLNSANQAVGLKKSPVEHSNFLNYKFDGGFPNCESVFRVLCHKTLRLVQQQILAQTLEGLALALFSKPKPQIEYDKIISDFITQIDSEKNICLTTDRTRREIELHLSWTECFYQQVIKLFEPLESEEGIQTYRPMRAYPMLTSLGVIIELALRQLLKQLQNNQTECCFIQADKGQLLTLKLCFAGQGPIALSIVSNQNILIARDIIHHCINHVIWVINPESGLWINAIESKGPSNELLWQLACGQTVDEQELLQILEVKPCRKG